MTQARGASCGDGLHDHTFVKLRQMDHVVSPVPLGSFALVVVDGWAAVTVLTPSPSEDFGLGPMVVIVIIHIDSEGEAVLTPCGKSTQPWEMVGR